MHATFENSKEDKMTSKVSVYNSMGDLLQVHPQDGWDVHIGHGVNCQGVMGSGIAKAFADNIPGLESSYKRFVQSNKGKHLVGMNHPFWWDDRRITVDNMFTQRQTGADARASAVLTCIHEWLLSSFCSSFGDENYRLALPEIGCGIGGLEWSCLSSMILNEVKTTVDDYAPPEIDNEIEIYLVSFTKNVNPINRAALKLYSNYSKVL